MGYSPTYLKTINNQLSAIFNYAVRYYDLKSNPCAKAGSMGKSKAEEMDFWTGEEFRSINVNIKMYIFDHLRMYIFAILPLDRYIFLSDKIFL